MEGWAGVGRRDVDLGLCPVLIAAIASSINISGYIISLDTDISININTI